MDGNIAFDVVTGLVFIYLLYSLYATVVMELIASFLGLRARNLSYALNRMLTDEKKYIGKYGMGLLKKWGARLMTTLSRITGKAINQNSPKLFDTFFNQSTIKYLSSGGIGNTPSYISAENFSKALIDAIKTKNPAVGTLACLQDGLEKSNVFVNNPETKAHIQSLLDDANNDLARFKILLENWFNDTMERASGWYKQTTQSLLILIGFVIAFSFNVDTLAIIKKLSKDDNARNALVTMAVNFTEKNPSITNPQANQPDSATQAQLRATYDSLMVVKETLQADIKSAQGILGFAWNIPDSIAYYENPKLPKDIAKGFIEIPYMKDNTTIFMTIPGSLELASFQKALKAGNEASLWEKFKGLFIETDKNNSKASKAGFLQVSSSSYKWSYFWRHFWGYLFTVLALSLGAPFWFDLLNKLVKLRTSVSTPNEPAKNTESVSNRKNTINRAG